MNIFNFKKNYRTYLFCAFKINNTMHLTLFFLTYLIILFKYFSLLVTIYKKKNLSFYLTINQRTDISYFFKHKLKLTNKFLTKC